VLAVLGGGFYLFLGKKNAVLEAIQPVRGPAVQAVTHDMDFAGMGDRRVHIVDGQIT